jgi:flagellar hook-associated protein 1 FlgK
MPGLFGLLNLGSQSLITGRQGVEVAGQNLANVNNPAYARQRLSIVTSPTVDSALGPQGTGAEGVSIVRIRSGILDGQIQDELGVSASLQAQESGLRLAEAALGQELARLGTGSQAGAAGGIAGTSHGLAEGMVGLFNEFQALSTDPASMTQRQSVLSEAADLAAHFNQVDGRLNEVETSLNRMVEADVSSANALLSQIASLNDDISGAELGAPGSANDLRDLRQSRIEDLAKLVQADVSEDGLGGVNVTIGGVLMVTGSEVADTLETRDEGGRLMLQAVEAGVPVTVTSGTVHGAMEARDGAVSDLRQNLNTLASALIAEVNSVHAPGFSLSGTTGGSFFEGTDAGNIRVNPALVENPSLLQAASVAGASGDNGAALALAQLRTKPLSVFGGQTFTEEYSRLSSKFGEALASVNSQLEDEQVVQNMLLRQRDSISGVSIDEELTDLTRFERAFQASARLLSVVDGLLETVVNMKR